MKVPIWEETSKEEQVSGLSSDKTAEAEPERDIQETGAKEMDLPDSDDDLVPHETTSEDKLRNKMHISKPKYLQDCFDG